MQKIGKCDKVCYGSRPVVNGTSRILHRAFHGHRFPMRKNGKCEISRAGIDSGADVHILCLDGALKLFRDIRISALDVIGVNGFITRDDRQGQLVVTLKYLYLSSCIQSSLLASITSSWIRVIRLI